MTSLERQQAAWVGLKRGGIWVVWIEFAFVLFYSGAWLQWAERLAEQALESTRRVANQLRLLVLRGRLLLLSVLHSAALRLQLKLASALIWPVFTRFSDSCGLLHGFVFLTAEHTP